MSSRVPLASCLDSTVSTGYPICPVQVSIRDFTGLPEASSMEVQRSAVCALAYWWANRYFCKPVRKVSGLR